MSLLLAVAIDLRDLGRCGGVSGTVLIHQDLKPSNIIMATSPVERATVIDLDTAFFLGEPTDAVPCGSYGYTAPEGIMRTPGWENENLDVFSSASWRMRCSQAAGRTLFRRACATTSLSGRLTFAGEAVCASIPVCPVMCASWFGRAFRSILACARARPN
ncbi:MAG: hypothetical protein V8S24_12995 [Gordonibacter pamelaeae]